MKRLTVFLITAFLSLTFIPSQLKAAPKPIAATIPATNPEALKANALILRLNEIKTIDKSKLTSAEKKKLRQEVRSVKKQLREISGGIYLSVGAIVIIILLLIILL